MTMPIKLPKQLESVFIDILVAEKGSMWMLIIWLYLFVAGLVAASTFSDTSRPFNLDSNSRLFIGLLASYISMSCIFHKLRANNIIEL
jgi:hypothetical protein